jgi:hypothetical protein
VTIPILTTATAIVALTTASTTAASLDFLREAPGCRVSGVGGIGGVSSVDSCLLGSWGTDIDIASHESESRKGRGFSDGDRESVMGENRRGGLSALSIDTGGETAAETTLERVPLANRRVGEERGGWERRRRQNLQRDIGDPCRLGSLA